MLQLPQVFFHHPLVKGQPLPARCPSFSPQNWNDQLQQPKTETNPGIPNNLCQQNPFVSFQKQKTPWHLLGHAKGPCKILHFQGRWPQLWQQSHCFRPTSVPPIFRRYDWSVLVSVFLRFFLAMGGLIGEFIADDWYLWYIWYEVFIGVCMVFLPLLQASFDSSDLFGNNKVLVASLVQSAHVYQIGSTSFRSWKARMIPRCWAGCSTVVALLVQHLSNKVVEVLKMTDVWKIVICLRRSFGNPILECRETKETLITAAGSFSLLVIWCWKILSSLLQFGWTFHRIWQDRQTLFKSRGSRYDFHLHRLKWRCCSFAHLRLDHSMISKRPTVSSYSPQVMQIFSQTSTSYEKGITSQSWQKSFKNILQTMSNKCPPPQKKN